MIIRGRERTSAFFASAVLAVYLASSLDPEFVPVRALAGSVILLFLLGHSLRVFLRVACRPSPVPLWTPSGIALDFLTSLGITLGTTAALMVSRTFFAWVFDTVILLFVAGLSVATLLFHHRTREAESRPAELSPWMLLCVGILAIISISLFVLFRLPTPYPSISGWDMFSPEALAGRAIEEHGFPYLLIPSFPDVGIPYPASFMQGVAAYSVFLGVDPHAIFYYGVVVTLLSYTAVVFALARKLAGGFLYPTAAAIAAVLLGILDEQVVRTPMYLTVDMMAQLIFLAILLFYLADEGPRPRRWGLVLVFSAFLLYSYYYEVLVIAPFLALMAFELWAREDARRQRIVFGTALVGALVTIVAGVYIALFLNPALALESEVTFPMSLKVETLEIIYAAPFLFLLALAGLSRLKPHEGREVRGIGFWQLAAYSGAYVGLYFLPYWPTYRFEFYFRCALALLVAFIWRPPLGAGSQMPPSPSPGNAVRFLTRHRIALEGLPVRAAVIVAIGFMLVTAGGHVQQPGPVVSLDEYDAASWVRTHASDGAYVVTDPGTGFMVRAVALVNTSIYFILPDGRMPADPTGIYPGIWNLTYQILSGSTTQQAFNQTQALGFKEAYILVTTRTVAWVLNQGIGIIDRPIPNMDFTSALRLFSQPRFVLQYQAPTAYVFKASL